MVICWIILDYMRQRLVINSSLFNLIFRLYFLGGLGCEMVKEWRERREVERKEKMEGGMMMGTERRVTG